MMHSEQKQLRPSIVRVRLPMVQGSTALGGFGATLALCWRRAIVLVVHGVVFPK